MVGEILVQIPTHLIAKLLNHLHSRVVAHLDFHENAPRLLFVRPGLASQKQTAAYAFPAHKRRNNQIGNPGGVPDALVFKRHISDQLTHHQPDKNRGGVCPGMD